METPHDSEVYSYNLSSSYPQECINSSTFNSGLGVPTGNILTMSTCDYDYANARYVCCWVSLRPLTIRGKRSTHT